MKSVIITQEQFEDFISTAKLSDGPLWNQLEAYLWKERQRTVIEAWSSCEHHDDQGVVTLSGLLKRLETDRDMNNFIQTSGSIDADGTVTP